MSSNGLSQDARRLYHYLRNRAYSEDRITVSDLHGHSATASAPPGIVCPYFVSGGGDGEEAFGWHNARAQAALDELLDAGIVRELTKAEWGTIPDELGMVSFPCPFFVSDYDDAEAYLTA